MVVLLASCIKEDYSDCERTLNLTFSYTGDGQTDIFPDKITCVGLYVFDAQDKLVQTDMIERDELKAFQGARLNLPAGRYRVVGVGNCFDKTQVINTSAGDMSEICFCHPAAETGGEVEGNDSLYMGSRMIEVPEGYGSYDDDVAFRSSHLKVSYTVKGYVPSRASALELRVKNVLPHTNFNNEPHGDKMTYTPALERDAENGEHTGYFNIMRHTADCDVEFELVDSATGEVVHTLALKDFCSEFADVIDLTKQEVLIPIVVEFRSIGVIVTIPDWLVTDVDPDFGNK